MDHSSLRQCDICANQVAQGDGFGLTTSQVATSESYWQHVLGTMRPSPIQLDPRGENIGSLINQIGNEMDPWLVCKSCAPMFHFNKREARDFVTKGALLSNPGPAEIGLVAFAAAYAWSALFDAWPAGIALRTEDPPSNGSVCDFCRRTVYPDENLTLMKESALEQYEYGGGLKRRGGPSTEANGVLLWVACPLCINRAHRIMNSA